MVKEKAHLHGSDLLEVSGNLTKGYSMTAGFPDGREDILSTTESHLGTEFMSTVSFHSARGCSGSTQDPGAR